MLTKSLVLVAVASGLSQAASVGIHARAHLHLAERATANAGSGSLTLDQAAVQSGSFVDGSKQIGAAEVGQALSATSTDNFINFCSGQTLTNGLQITTGSCNGIRQFFSSVVPFVSDQSSNGTTPGQNKHDILHHHLPTSWKRFQDPVRHHL